VNYIIQYEVYSHNKLNKHCKMTSEHDKKIYIHTNTTRNRRSSIKRPVGFDRNPLSQSGYWDVKTGVFLGRLCPSGSTTKSANKK